MTPEKTMFCADCGNDDIVWRVWADEFDNISHSCEDKFVFCNDCDDETRPIMSTARNKEGKS
jgi:hypothetical protein